MVSSTESAITSRDGSEDFMPSWPMAMPSVTVMVQNSRGVPPAGRDALLGGLGLAHQRDVAGRGFVPAGGDADERLVDLRRGQTHGVIVRAMRRALRTFGHVAAGQLGLELGLGVHRRSCDVAAASRCPRPSAAVSPAGLLLADFQFRPSRYPIRLKKPEMSQRLGTAFDLGEGYGQIAARCSKRRCYNSNVPRLLPPRHRW